MSWSFVAHRGSANNKVSGTLLAVAPSAQIPVGAIVLAIAVSDNIQNAAATEDHVVTDFKGNRWEKLGERTNAAAAGAGITLSVWASRLTTALATTDNVVLGVRSATTAKAIGLYEVSVAASSGFCLAGIAASEQDGTQAPTVTLNGLESGRQYAFLGIVAREADVLNTFVQDADYADRTAFGTTGGTGNTNVSVIVGTRIGTIVGDTFAPTALSVAADCVTALVALAEIPGMSITVNAATNDGANLSVIYTRNQHPSNYISWPLNRLADTEITPDGMEQFLLRLLVTVARRRNLSAAQMVGKTISVLPGATRNLITLEG